MLIGQRAGPDRALRAAPERIGGVPIGSYVTHTAISRAPPERQKCPIIGQCKGTLSTVLWVFEHCCLPVTMGAGSQYVGHLLEKSWK